MSLDYDLYVIDPTNLDTSMHQLRDCLKDAIDELAKRTASLDDRLNKLENEADVEDNKVLNKEPLIKDEKIRKAVRAWADGNNIESVHYDAFWRGFRRDKSSITVWEELPLEDNKVYAIAELCGEGEE